MQEGGHKGPSTDRDSWLSGNNGNNIDGVFIASMEEIKGNAEKTVRVQDTIDAEMNELPWRVPVKIISNKSQKEWKKEQKAKWCSKSGANQFQMLQEEEEEASEGTSGGEWMSLEELGKHNGDEEKVMAVEGSSNEDKWEHLPQPIIVDSGASISVLPKGWGLKYPIKETEASRRGTAYKVANGATVRNEGERMITIGTKEGKVKNLRFQVADVSKALCSVASIVRAGHRVVFDSDHSYILHKGTGETIKLRLENGVYVLDAMVAPVKWARQQGFARQES